ncbi:hypothetical protein U1Q18_016239, partial [Sarracenia purpurea var. burkii]
VVFPKSRRSSSPNRDVDQNPRTGSCFAKVDWFVPFDWFVLREGRLPQIDWFVLREGRLPQIATSNRTLGLVRASRRSTGSCPSTGSCFAKVVFPKSTGSCFAKVVFPKSRRRSEP